MQLQANGGSRFFVHKDVLTTQSKQFRDALTGRWKEATKLKINLFDWDGATVCWLLEFLYRGSYRYPEPGETSSKDETQVVESGPVILGARIARSIKVWNVMLYAASRVFADLDLVTLLCPK